MILRITVFSLLVILCNSCTKKKGDVTTITFSFIPFYKEKIYLERIPFANEEWQVLDSFQLTYATDKVSFTIPPQDEAVFQLRIEGRPLRIIFINDVPEVNISSKTSDAKDYAFNNGGINPSLRSFMLENKILEEQISVLAAEKSTLEPSSSNATQLSKQLDSLYNALQQRAKNFIDTTSSPAAFLFVYNKIEFGKDFKLLEKVVTKASERFQFHTGIQKLKEAFLRIVRIFEEEYQPGENLPYLSLPDISGKEISTATFKGKYVFIDMWSTWCPPCFSYIPIKQELNKTLGTHLQLVTIAVDAEKQKWIQMVQQYQIPGIHLIDEQMWQGNAVATYKMDSIPFNFLISPEGKILAKAIKPDSVLAVVRRYISGVK